jgi:hypothetical protein
MEDPHPRFGILECPADRRRPAALPLAALPYYQCGQGALTLRSPGMEHNFTILRTFRNNPGLAVDEKPILSN